MSRSLSFFFFLLVDFLELVWNISEKEQIRKDPPGALPQGPGSGERRAEQVINQ